MKLLDALNAKSATTTEVISEVVDTSSRTVSDTKHRHAGALHIMGIDPASKEYEEMSTDLDRLAETDPVLYHRIMRHD